MAENASAGAIPGSAVWFAAYTNPNCEERVKLGLRSKGYRAFVPELTKWARVGRRRERVRRPLFVRYVLIGLHSHHLTFGDIRDTDGVQALVGIEGTPRAIPADFVNDLALAVVTGAFDYTVDEIRKPRFVCGEKVRFAKGPFADKIGQIKNADSDRRVEILLSLMGRETMVVADIDHLRAA